MNKGPWGAQPRTAASAAGRAVRSPLGRFAGIALVVTALFGSVLFGKYQTDQASKDERMPTSAYGDLVTLARSCPVMRGPIRVAMKDGFLTRGEARSIRETGLARQKAYQDAAARRDAAASVGAPPVMVPPKCDNSATLLAPTAD